jgi:two-component sensor histidine kinase
MKQLETQIAFTLRLMRTASTHRQVETEVQSLLRAQTLTIADLVEERRRREVAEAALRVADEALAAGRAALKEAHHRVKNSLQMASNVLALQARATESEVVRFACNDAHRRLNLLAKVHELLEVDSKGSTALYMPSLLLAVSDALQQSFAEQTGAVTLHALSDPLRLLPSIAIPIALVVNEALTNIYKHAFGEAGGTITVELRATGDNGMTLRITDNGRGLQPGDRKDGLGLRLIRGLALQLRGTVNYATPVETTGTVLELCVPPSTGVHVQVGESINVRMSADTNRTISQVRATEFRRAQPNGS